jgi:hypothetical protein
MKVSGELYAPTALLPMKNPPVPIGSLSKGCHLDVVRGPSTPHDPESDVGGSVSSWQGHPKPVWSRMREEAKNNPRRRELR